MSELILGDDLGEFFAPASTDMVDSLIAQYSATKAEIERVSGLVDQALSGGLFDYFVDGNCDRSRGGGLHLKHGTQSLFDKAGAIANLNSAYWAKAMQMTDVMEYMPQKRRDEWYTAIQDMTCPEFEEATVRDTLMGLLNMRSQFFAEKVDGIFRGLSGEHVTNSPMAFGKRMIVSHVLTEYGTVDYRKSGLISDLRAVIAKFMGRDEPGHRSSEPIIRHGKQCRGEWVTIDGGALKIRVYKKGTAHLEVHPDMAWRLNAILANLYPSAIPAKFRNKPPRKLKDIELMQRPLPMKVVDLLSSAVQYCRWVDAPENWRNDYRKKVEITNAVKFDAGADKHVMAEGKRILESIGGVWMGDYCQFDYNALELIREIAISGVVPDQKSHQFYPTPEKIARMAMELAAIGDNHTCLEPSAGIGGLADYMPKDRTSCIEISELHAKVLMEKGFYVVNEDFLKCVDQKFDRIVMNPPFDRNQWKAHLEHAASMVAQDGRLVAILPASAKGKVELPGFNCSYPQTFDNEFTGTSVSVVILVADKV
jgi:Domain of unknown function (DUF4942)